MISRVITPTLAKYARMGHPTFRYVKEGRRLGHTPMVNHPRGGGRAQEEYGPCARNLRW